MRTIYSTLYRDYKGGHRRNSGDREFVTYWLRWPQWTAWWTIRWATPSTPQASPKHMGIRSLRQRENFLSLRRLVGKEYKRCCIIKTCGGNHKICVANNKANRMFYLQWPSLRQ